MSQGAFQELNSFRLKYLSGLETNTLHEKYVALLTIRVVELCQDSLELLCRKNAASTPIILRSALETYIDLLCLIKDPTYIDDMNKSFDFYKAKLAGDKVNWKELPNIYEKFKIAGEQELYNGFYAYLCRSSHGNLEMLAHFHSKNGELISGMEHEPATIRQFVNQTMTVSTSALIECISFINSNTNVDDLRSVQHRAGSGEYV